MTEESTCRLAFEQRLGSPEGEAAWREHLKQCDGCREQAHDLSLLLDPLRDQQPPALSDEARLQMMDQFVALTAGEAETILPAAGESRRAWPLRAAAAAAAAVLLLGGTWYVLRWLHDPTPDAPPTVTRETAGGTNRSPMKAPSVVPASAAPPLYLFASQGDLVYRQPGKPNRRSPPRVLPKAGELETLGPGSSILLGSTTRDLRLRLGPRSRLQRIAAAGWSIRLKRGDLMVDVRSKSAGLALRIVTTRGEITIRGTHFLVQEATARTRITVFRGEVSYHSHASGRHLVLAGQQLVDDSQHIKVRQSTVQPMPADLGVKSMVRPAPAKSAKKACRLDRIRRLLRQGRARGARAVIAACRKSGVSGGIATTLKMLEAQALLALGKVRAAVRVYHRIARQKRGHRVGQNALFSAGQLELNRLGQRRRALATFKRYIKQYPSGRYRSEARQLIRSLEKRSHDR